MVQRLAAGAVNRRCNPDRFTFNTTSELEILSESLGQPRAVAALEFGIETEHQGYNIFALGQVGLGRHSLIRQFLERRASQRSVPSDWCHVYNFENARRPRLLRLAAGTGCRLSRDLERFAEELRSALDSAFESEEYHTRHQVIEEAFKTKSEKIFAQLEGQAREQGVAVLKTPVGLAFAPLRGESVMPPDEFRKLPEADRKALEEVVNKLESEFQQILRQMPKWERERQEAIRELNREVTRFAIEHLIDELKATYEDQPVVGEYLEAAKEDLIENARQILHAEEPAPGLPGTAAAQGTGPGLPLRRYQVNVLVDNSAQTGAPVVYEDNPSLQNLIGRIEHMSQMGALVTDFTLIKGGALHRANGGYLILDARRLLTEPFAWEGLKRALRSHRIRIESPGEALSLISTVSLEPEPVPLEVKVVLVGEPLHYYLLSWYDPDFAELFKVPADFDSEMERSEENEAIYARLLATRIRKLDLRPFDRTGVARVIEASARLASDAAKLSTQVGEVDDLLRESDYWARQEGREVVEARAVEQAIKARVYRSDRIRERILEQMLRETVLIETAGSRVGQINGLSVLQLGNFSFGRASRITARVRIGKGEVVNIEREVELSGPLHSKGVLILSGFLGARFASDRPLSLHASLVFEQSYGGIDGDSASSAELYALLSAISDVPIRQSLAVTGSVNQLGQVQAIGGVNEKIEGFFDLCQARGLSGEQGVLIPSSNVQHLMLRGDVVEAVAAARFHIYPIATVDEGIEVLTGVPAGEREDGGGYPEETVNRRVEDRLGYLIAQTRKLGAASTEQGESP